MITRTIRRAAAVGAAGALAALVLLRGELGRRWAAKDVANKPRILQTNFAGDNITLIDPTTNKVVGKHSRDRGEPRRGGGAGRDAHLRQL